MFLKNYSDAFSTRKVVKKEYWWLLKLTNVQEKIIQGIQGSIRVLETV